jgi:hypothetical protein
MRPIFTIHAGEFLLGAHLEAAFKGINIWVPAKDTGVDLLITDRGNKKTVSFQVKFSRDFLTTHMEAMFQNPLRVCGWFSLEVKRSCDRLPIIGYLYLSALKSDLATSFLLSRQNF